jgi:hypothetical protein
VDTKNIVAAACLGASLCVAAEARAGTISLATPLIGSSSAPYVDLTVSFDPNGNISTNITGWELYVSFSGLTPVNPSYALGSLFQPFADDVYEEHGICGDGAPCSAPPADTASSQQWISLASVFAPHLPSGPGTLFTLRLAVDPGSPSWSLSLFGESAGLGDPCGTSSALLWDHETDGQCPIAPFLIVPEGSTVGAGTARVGVSAIAASPTPVPDQPSTLLLMTAAMAGLLTLRRTR